MQERLFFLFLTLLDHSSWLQPYFEICILYLSSFTSNSESSGSSLLDIALTRMIRDVAHAHDDTKQGTMAIVASDMTLYTTYMSKAETLVAFCCTFQTSIDTINPHGGSAGCHPKLFDEYIARLMSERGLDKNGDPDKLEMVIRDMERQSCDKYVRAYIEMPTVIPLDRRITDRWALIQAVQGVQCCILSL